MVETKVLMKWYLRTPESKMGGIAEIVEELIESYPILQVAQPVDLFFSQEFDTKHLPFATILLGLKV